MAAKTGIICQGCGVEAPTKYLEFHQNVGALVVRFSKQYKGQMCKGCAHRHFWKATGTTLAVGWLGTISLIIAPIFVLMNLARYVGALGMPAVPAGARPPVLTPDAVDRIGPFRQELVDRLNRGGRAGAGGDGRRGEGGRRHAGAGGEVRRGDRERVEGGAAAASDGRLPGDAGPAAAAGRGGARPDPARTVAGRSTGRRAESGRPDGESSRDAGPPARFGDGVGVNKSGADTARSTGRNRTS